MKNKGNSKVCEKNKKISTRPLTVLIIGVIVRIEQKRIRFISSERRSL